MKRGTRSRLLRRSAQALLIGLAGFLAACDPFLLTSTQPAEPVGPDLPEIAQPSAASRALSDYYAGVERDLRSQGLLRVDSGANNAPYGPRELAENFTRIALFDEYVLTGGRLVQRPTASRLRRWSGPVNLSVEFGETVPQETRRRDIRTVTEFAMRMQRLTGLPVRVNSGGFANFHILILNEDERRVVGPRLRELMPGIGSASIRTIENLPRSTFCLVLTFAGASQSAPYSRAVAVIRAEHPNLMRTSCLHEEIAQGFGLANDSPTARPSIFNDDEEFSLLTKHDELLLRMLYDPRLRIGMTAEDADPIIAEIAAEFFPGSS